MWDIKDVLAIGESVVYQCPIKCDEGKYEFVMTNYRIITIGEDHYLYSVMINSITSVMMVDGYDDWAADDDVGDGDYAVRWYTDVWESIWFQSSKVRKEVYDEIMRALIEEL